MAWKNLKQLSLADSLTSEHEALTELDDINELVDWEAIEHLLGGIHAKRRGNSAKVSPYSFLYNSTYDRAICSVVNNLQ